LYLSEIQIARITAVSSHDLERVVQEIRSKGHMKSAMEVVIAAVNKHEKEQSKRQS
jgi:carbamoylphosphate synthase small subunit